MDTAKAHSVLAQTYAVAMEVLLEYPLCRLTNTEMCQEKWSRKVLKIYKKLKATEDKVKRDLETEFENYSFLGTRLFKLVLVLFKLRKGVDQKAIREELDIQNIASKTDEVCNESETKSVVSNNQDECL
jgi:hypothetical protein